MWVLNKRDNKRLEIPYSTAEIYGIGPQQECRYNAKVANLKYTVVDICGYQ
jgi:hypothetical protein